MKTNESSLTPEQKLYIEQHRFEKCISELALEQQTTYWKVKKYLLMSGLDYKKGRWENVHQPELEGEYFNVHLYRGDYTWLV